MRFITQRSSKECGICVVRFVLINYQNTEILSKISTKYLPLSTMSVLLSSNLVDNKLKLVENKLIFEWSVFPIILHCNILGTRHYIVALKKINNFLLIYDPTAFGFKYLKLSMINKIWSGYMIECQNLKSKCIKNCFYLPYPIFVVLKFIIFDLLLISIFIFLFYLKK